MLRHRLLIRLLGLSELQDAALEVLKAVSLSNIINFSILNSDAFHDVHCLILIDELSPQLIGP